LSDSIIAALRRACAGNDTPLHLHEPTLGGQEWTYVKECLDSGWVSSAGKYVDRIEEMLQELTGASRAVAVVNGTAALHAALVAVGVRPGDEVLVPTLTFVGTANAVHHAGALPHFVDSSEVTLGIDPASLADYLAEVARVEGDRCIHVASGRRIAALVPVHIFGHPVDMDPLLELAERYRLVVVEDAAESIGSEYKGKHTGVFGRVGVLSFNGNKTITTGGGGALLTADPELGARLKHLTTTAKLPHRWRYEHDEAGFNYRMPNLNAAMGCAQLEMLPTLLANKRTLAQRYIDAFADVQGATVLREPSFAKSNYWLNTLLVEGGVEQRDAVLEASHAAGFMLRPAWEPLHRLPMYRDCPAMPLRVAERLAEQLINLPSSAHLVKA
jgi:perosamine synthetase